MTQNQNLILVSKFSVLFWTFSMVTIALHKPWSPTWTGRLSTVDLPVLTSLDQLVEMRYEMWDMSHVTKFSYLTNIPLTWLKIYWQKLWDTQKNNIWLSDYFKVFYTVTASQSDCNKPAYRYAFAYLQFLEQKNSSIRMTNDKWPADMSMINWRTFIKAKLKKHVYV